MKKNRLHETAVPTIFSHHEIIMQRLLGKGLTGNLYLTNVSTGIPAHVTSLHTLLYKYPKAGNSFTILN